MWLCEMCECERVSRDDRTTERAEKMCLEANFYLTFGFHTVHLVTSLATACGATQQHGQRVIVLLPMRETQ